MKKTKTSASNHWRQRKRENYMAKHIRYKLFSQLGQKFDFNFALEWEGVVIFCTHRHIYSSAAWKIPDGNRASLSRLGTTHNVVSSLISLIQESNIGNKRRGGAIFDLLNERLILHVNLGRAKGAYIIPELGLGLGLGLGLELELRLG